jgi:uncharacterized protein
MILNSTHFNLEEPYDCYYPRPSRRNFLSLAAIANFRFIVLNHSTQSAMNELEILNAASARFTQDHPNLKLLILFGSRARGEEDPSSDWDFAFLTEPDRPPQPQSYWFPGSELLNTLCNLLEVSDETIDLVDLSTCSDILAHFVARDGQVIYEKMPGEFSQFQQQSLKTNADLKQYRHTQREKVLETLQRWAV